MTKRILVYADWQGMEQPELVGTLTAEAVRGKEVFSFDYAAKWLQSDHARVLDPDLQLFTGPQFLRDDKPNFGMFLDSSPDRWGRVLMRRREAVLARREARSPAIFHESDFLLGVHDAARMGGLRFKLDETGEFLNHVSELAAPPWVKLRELEHASLKLETDSMTAAEELKWLNMLMAPGSSLGGARPKASVIDPDGNLWIAKFPSSGDDHDIGAWEMVVHELAVAAGIRVAPARLERFSGRHHTFLTRRFDRDGAKRIHFASAMTLLGQQDGADFQQGLSYLDLASFIVQHGRNVMSNLHELWARMLFNVMVKNTDDHLRNHGFLLETDGWELSPAYDMNPNPYGTGLTLNISDDDNALDVGLVFSVAKYFRLKPIEAESIMIQMRNVVSSWETVATRYNLSRSERGLMAVAFKSS